MAKIVDVMEKLYFPLFDTVYPPGSGKDVILFGSANCGKTDLSNLLTPSTIPSDGSFIIRRLVVGAPKEVLRTWASVQMTLSLNMKPMLTMPMWFPPDQSPAGIEATEEMKKALVAQRIETPLDWEFLAWPVVPNAIVLPRMYFDVRVRAYDDKPTGNVRVILDGDMIRPVY